MINKSPPAPSFSKRGNSWNKGYTLIELLVAILISLLVTLSITKFFITEHHIYSVQEARAEMNQTVRGAINMLSRELLLAGYGIPPWMKWINTFSRDEIEFMTNLRDVRATLSADAPAGDVRIDIKEGNGRSFGEKDVIIICNNSTFDTCERHTLSEDGKTDYIRIESVLGSAFPAGSTVNLINTINYRYDPSKKAVQRKIDRGNWEPVAEHVSTDGFSMTYRDKNNNAPVLSSAIHEVDIGLTVESFRRDSSFKENNGYRLNSANTTVMLRN
ncbi:MAG: prepilin-type N-terminal cleavage/methylation domain-containing protein [Nitrospirae bacterium]|nr:prepilin-type N-terminal cleavage/methylation domain-containing protein [Nitrospirota bacterium]